MAFADSAYACIEGVAVAIPTNWDELLARPAPGQKRAGDADPNRPAQYLPARERARREYSLLALGAAGPIGA